MTAGLLARPLESRTPTLNQIRKHDRREVTRMTRPLRIAAILLVLLALPLGGCKSFGKKKEEKQPAMKKDKAALREENNDVDFQAFVGRLRKAVASRDMNAIAAMMSSDFGYSLNPEKSGPGVFQYWDENNLWPELEGILSERFAKKGEFWVAPPQFADESLNYDGFRVGIRRVNGSWKFVYFVNG
jgi:hypothetical protein